MYGLILWQLWLLIHGIQANLPLNPSSPEKTRGFFSPHFGDKPVNIPCFNKLVSVCEAGVFFCKRAVGIGIPHHNVQYNVLHVNPPYGYPYNVRLSTAGSRLDAIASVFLFLNLSNYVLLGIVKKTPFRWRTKSRLTRSLQLWPPRKYLYLLPNLCPPFADQMSFFLQEKRTPISVFGYFHVFPVFCHSWHLGISTLTSEELLQIVPWAWRCLRWTPCHKLNFAGAQGCLDKHIRDVFFFFGWITGGHAYDPMRFLMQIFWWISMSKSY